MTEIIIKRFKMLEDNSILQAQQQSNYCWIVCLQVILYIQRPEYKDWLTAQQAAYDKAMQQAIIGPYFPNLPARADFISQTYQKFKLRPNYCEINFPRGDTLPDETGMGKLIKKQFPIQVNYQGPGENSVGHTVLLVGWRTSRLGDGSQYDFLMMDPRKPRERTWKSHQSLKTFQSDGGPTITCVGMWLGISPDDTKPKEL